mmetsp:Transcript_44157/g.65482  ORF Transcript_44157/g.65482 Transcript_44157/m.65482 type:complete len:81 (+) Transcript_44157:71-313(+)
MLLLYLCATETSSSGKGNGMTSIRSFKGDSAACYKGANEESDSADASHPSLQVYTQQNAHQAFGLMLWKSWQLTVLRSCS